MPKPDPKKETANKADLHKILNCFTSYYEPPRKAEMRKAVVKAEKDFEHFRKTNVEYRRLHVVLSKAKKSFDAHIEGSKKQFHKELQACRNAIYLRGAIPSTIKMIEALIKKYPGAMK